MPSMLSNHSDGPVQLPLPEMAKSQTSMLVMAASVETIVITQSFLQMLRLIQRNKTLNQNHKVKTQQIFRLQRRRKREKVKKRKRNEYKLIFKSRYNLNSMKL